MAVCPEGRAIQLVSWDADSQHFQLGQEALDVLRRITTPISVVAVAGRARQVGWARLGAPRGARAAPAPHARAAGLSARGV